VNLTFDPKTFEVVDTKAKLNQWVRHLEKAKSFCFDSETTGLDIWRDELVGLSFSYEDNGNVPSAYLPLAHHKGRNLDVATVLNALAPVCLDKRKGKLFHNAAYDLAIFAQPRYSFSVENVHDSMYMAYALYGDTLPSLGMDYLSARFLGWETIKFNQVVTDIPGRKDFRDVPIEEACQYAAEDTAVTFCLGKVFQHQLQAEGRLWEVYTQDRKLIPILHRMKQKGVKVDVEKCRSLEAEWAKKVAELEEQAHHIHGKKFLLSSPKQVIEAIEARGLEVPENWRTGKKSVDKFALEDLAGDELIDVIAEHRKINKLLGTYARGLPKKVNELTGRVHPNFTAVRTSTGRFASNDPNFQNLSARTDEGLQIRETIVAG